MENGTKKTIWYDNNSEPPKDWIWNKQDGKFYEWNGKAWTVSSEVQEVPPTVTGISLDQAGETFFPGQYDLTATVTPLAADSLPKTFILADQIYDGDISLSEDGTLYVSDSVAGYESVCIAVVCGGLVEYFFIEVEADEDESDDDDDDDGE